ncbi:MAG: tryptophan 7-halogenase, partial [Mangrovicoccus sp.]
DFLTFDPTARVVQDRYNSIMNELFDHSADFLVLHYILSKREDTSFWRSVKADTVLSDRLKMLLELWQTKLVSDADLFDGQKPFEALNHAFILYGMDRTPAELPELIEFLPVKNSIDLFETIRQAQASAVQGTVDHRDFIQKYAGAFG